MTGRRERVIENAHERGREREEVQGGSQEKAGSLPCGLGIGPPKAKRRKPLQKTKLLPCSEEIALQRLRE